MRPSALPLSSTSTTSNTAHSPIPSPLPSPLPYELAKPVRKLSNAAMSAISAGESAFHALRSQVGGHPGVLASEDNLLIVKSCLENEKRFYELLALEDESVRSLKRWIPRFYGTLRLEGQVKKSSDSTGGDGNGNGNGDAPLEQGIEPSIVLENVSSLFTKPNIMDIKLGTVLYDEAASEEKKERMLATAKATTSLETGVRLTGFQVYDYTSSETIITPKTYGKSIKPSDLPDGVRRFFPLSSSSKPEGKGLPKDILLPILHGILNDIRAIRTALANTELRMVGGSLLIVYEADWEAARSALEAKAKEANAKLSSTEETNSAGVDTEAAKENEDDSDLESEEEEAPAYVVRLIDFAHTRLTPGEGPDEGVVKGVDTTISLLEGRIQEIESN